jgi:hypothetical protein
MIARARTVLPLALDVVAAAEAWHKASGPGGASWENTAREYAARQALLAALGAWKAAQ